MLGRGCPPCRGGRVEHRRGRQDVRAQARLACLPCLVVCLVALVQDLLGPLERQELHLGLVGQTFILPLASMTCMFLALNLFCCVFLDACVNLGYTGFALRRLV